MSPFQLVSPFEPAGHQPQAAALLRGIAAEKFKAGAQATQTRRGSVDVSAFTQPQDQSTIYYALGGLYAEEIFKRTEKVGAAAGLSLGVVLLGLMTGLHWGLGQVHLPLALVFALPGMAGMILLA